MIPAVNSKQRVLLSANTSWNIINFRSGLIRGLVAQGHDIHVAAPADRFSERIEGLGATFHPLSMSGAGLSPIKDLKTVAAYRDLFRIIRPDGFLPFTIKPNIYGGLAAIGLPIRILNNISGLGTAFMGEGPLQKLVSVLYRVALRKSATVFFQNREDADLFRQKKLVADRQVAFLPGSGVDLSRFAPAPKDGLANEAGVRFLMVGRLLRDKGVAEYIAAARMVREGHPTAQFRLLGPTGVDNPAAISADELDRLLAAGEVEYLGEADDVRDAMRNADCIVLPSYYREGVPRTLIEAAALGLPIITTDHIGCRDAVDQGVTGLLCAPRSIDGLAEAMRAMIAMGPEQRATMAKAGRQKAEREFDERLIVAAYQDALTEAI
ncbi:glycosyltransferase family 4 protein [Sphingomonas sp. LY160]|uniref:glycosyltransferase family 4 protein n=1 Tax=Sphingomonas sp. LY160 TaxID=3095342 RepID=UPI002ADEDAAC|nr:glycosyltransferase family 4 protein [Sphingomonas sp. LY160]MEA1071013.1 glycosyltransferase family 4 protein [Sphingomonas sp. LY160]